MKTEHVELLNLSPSERLLLVQDLWDSLDVEDVPLTQAQMIELDRRKAAYTADPNSTVLPQKTCHCAPDPPANGIAG
jgi:putative addiction module component (TIGR02574 family)